LPETLDVDEIRLERGIKTKRYCESHRLLIYTLNL